MSQRPLFPGASAAPAIPKILTAAQRFFPPLAGAAGSLAQTSGIIGNDSEDVCISWSIDFLRLTFHNKTWNQLNKSHFGDNSLYNSQHSGGGCEVMIKSDRDGWTIKQLCLNIFKPSNFWLKYGSNTQVVPLVDHHFHSVLITRFYGPLIFQSLAVLG